MREIRKILLPTDFSPASQNALDHALFWAEVNEAELWLLHVLSLRTADPFHPEHHFPEPAELEARLESLASGELASLIEAHREKMLRIKTLVRTSMEVDRGILELAKQEHFDLIVMGTHGRRGAAHLFMGSVATEVLRRATCPVLVVSARDGHPPARLDQVLAPIDFSPSSREAARWARDLAHASGGKLELFHVVPELEVPLPMNPGGLGAASALYQDLVPAARRELEEMAKGLGSPTAVTFEVWQGPAAPSILNRAATSEADLIVLAAHGHTAFDRWLVGSVTERVARLAACPVLVLPAPARDAD